jgi:hypothetical protein
MEFMKYRREMGYKYILDYSKYTKELDEFNDVATEYWDDMNAKRNSTDNKVNIRKPNKDNIENDGWDFYATKSKHYDVIDPRCSDNKSIQYAGEHRIYLICKNKETNSWEFPNISMFYGDTFELMKLKMHFQIFKDNFTIRTTKKSPSVVLTRNLNESELLNEKNKGLNGNFMQNNSYRSEDIFL